MSQSNTNTVFKNPNVKLFINNNEYLSEYCDNQSIKGRAYGKYFGSSTRIPGGEIWHPSTGYNSLQIAVEIKLENDNWIRVFDEVINFQDKILHQFIENNDKELQMCMEFCNPSPDELEKMEQNKNIKIQEILNGILCEFNSLSNIQVSNDHCKLNLSLRDLHRFEGEVQISGFSYELI